MVGGSGRAAADRVLAVIAGERHELIQDDYRAHAWHCYTEAPAAPTTRVCRGSLSKNLTSSHPAEVAPAAGQLEMSPRPGHARTSRRGFAVRAGSDLELTPSCGATQSPVLIAALRSHTQAVFPRVHSLRDQRPRQRCF